MKTLSFLILCTWIVITACNVPEEVSNDELAITTKTAQLIKTENIFGFELYQHVFHYETEQENIMVSPLSISLALAMTYNGARK